MSSTYRNWRRVSGVVVAFASVAALACIDSPNEPPGPADLEGDVIVTAVLTSQSGGASEFAGRTRSVRRPFVVQQVRGDDGRAHTLATLRDAAAPATPPREVFLFVDGRPSQAFEFNYARGNGRWRVIGGRFVTFDSVTGHQNREVRFQLSNLEKSLIGRLIDVAADALATAVRVVSPQPLSAAVVDEDDIESGPCMALMWEFIAASAAAEMAWAAWASAWLACKAIDAPDCPLADKLQDLAKDATAFATKKWSAVSECLDSIPKKPPPDSSSGGGGGGTSTPTVTICTYETWYDELTGEVLRVEVIECHAE